MEYAYATMEVKALQQDASGKRTFTGIASTITADRADDIVIPKGARYKLPLALCWQHMSREPIGWVMAARITDTQIEVDCEVHNEAEPGRLKDRLDNAWQELRAKLVRGLSIGFNPLKSARIEGSWGSEFQEWDWLELSPVTIGMNAECSITSIKSADQALRRASLGITGKHVVRLDPRAGGKPGNLPGASGDQRRKHVVFVK